MKIIKKKLFQNILKIIKQYDNIVIARHISPDPDAIASQIALREAIKLTYPHKNVYAIGAKVQKFKYLGNLDKIDLKTLENVLLVVLDVPNFARVDGIEELSYEAILKIDHHPREDIKGNVDWTDINTSSTCEMIANLILNTKLKMNTQIAQNLYVGIVFDSNRFLLQNTKIDTFKTVYFLLEKSKIDFVSLYDNLYGRSIDEAKFKAYLINNLVINENSFGYIFIDSTTLKEYNVDAPIVSNIVNDFFFIKELLCWMFVVYDKRNEIYKANIRSRGPVINKIANKYHGGGHKYASGARSVDYENMEKLAQELNLTCKEYLNEKNSKVN